MKIRMIIHIVKNTQEMYKQIKNLKHTPWIPTTRKGYPGYELRHKTYSRGYIILRLQKKLKETRKIDATALGTDRIRLAGSFIEWLLNYYANHITRIIVTPK